LIGILGRDGSFGLSLGRTWRRRLSAVRERRSWLLPQSGRHVTSVGHVAIDRGSVALTVNLRS